MSQRQSSPSRVGKYGSGSSRKSGSGSSSPRMFSKLAKVIARKGGEEAVYPAVDDVVYQTTRTGEVIDSTMEKAMDLVYARGINLLKAANKAKVIKQALVDMLGFGGQTEQFVSMGEIVERLEAMKDEIAQHPENDTQNVWKLRTLSKGLELLVRFHRGYEVVDTDNESGSPITLEGFDKLLGRIELIRAHWISPLKNVVVIGSKGTTPGQFNQPLSIAVCKGNGTLVVADSDNHRVQIFDAAGNFLRMIGAAKKGGALRKFVKTCGVAISDNGRTIVVADFGNSRIKIYGNEGRRLDTVFGSYGRGNGQFNAPNGIAIHPADGSIVVADSGNHRIQIFDNRGNFVRTFGKHGMDAGQLYSPMNVAIGPDGDKIIVTESNGRRVQVFDWAGNHISSIGSFDEDIFLSPYGVAVTYSGVVVVTDQMSNLVKMFDLVNGEHIRTLGVISPDPNARYAGRENVGVFNSPTGVAVSADGNRVFVSDMLNNRVQVFNFN